MSESSLGILEQNPTGSDHPRKYNCAIIFLRQLYASKYFIMDNHCKAFSETFETLVKLDFLMFLPYVIQNIET